MFSDANIAAFINNNFEPVWESVRPLPMVRIDFGDGRQIVRTLHGNIATYVCAGNGQVLDVLPGIYTPAAYRRALQQFALLPKYLVSPDSAEKASVRLVKYHETQARFLAEEGNPAVISARPSSDIGKGKIEGRLKYILRVPRDGEQMPEAAGPPFGETLASPSDLANWSALVEDTRVNERQRRRLIHEKLAAAGAVRPDNIKKWLYKEVLHAELDDPYLGLGPTLFANYPFKD